MINKDRPYTHIYETFNYRQFKIMAGNRPINKKKVEAIKKSMQKRCPVTLVKVDSDFYVLDGQHNLQAREELGMPVYYYISPEEDIVDVRTMNEKQNNWTVWDYVHSFAEMGHEEYVKLIRLSETFKEFKQKSFFIRVALMSFRGYKYDKNHPIKEGHFEFLDYDRTFQILGWCRDYKIVAGANSKHSIFLLALLKIMRCDNYDHNRMIKALEKQPYIIPRTNSQGYVEELQERFNYNQRKKIMFIHEDIE